MRRISLAAAALAALAAAACSGSAAPLEIAQPRVVEASCGQCRFEMAGARAGGCDLAVRIDGRCYYVRGTDIDDHGDAHASDGFCNAVRHARVTGRVDADEFVATTFELVSE